MSNPLDKKTCLEVLVRCCVAGQAKGTFSIKDASYLYRIINHLRGVKKDETLEEKVCFDTLVRATVVANTKGVFSLEEAALIDKVVEHLEAENLLTKAPEEEKEDTPKIKEV